MKGKLNTTAYKNINCALLNLEQQFREGTHAGLMVRCTQTFSVFIVTFSPAVTETDVLAPELIGLVSRILIISVCRLKS